MSIINPFALLGDEEDDDVSTLVAHVASKAGAAAAVPRSLPPSVKKAEEPKFPVKQTDSGCNDKSYEQLWDKVFEQAQAIIASDFFEQGRGRGGRGRGSGRNGLDGNGIDQSGNKRADGFQRSYGGSNGYQRSSGGSNGYQNNNDEVGGNQRNYGGANGYQRNRGTGNGYQRNHGRDSYGNAVDERRHGGGGGERVLNENHEPEDSNQIKIENEQIKSQGQMMMMMVVGNRRVTSPKKEEGDSHETKEGNHGNKEHEINDNNNSGGPEGETCTRNKKDADERKRAAVERQNQMTLGEYEKQLLEKRKNLPALQKTEGKRVIVDKEFESMQRIDKKKEDSLFIKLKTENDKLKRNSSFDKEEKVHKAVSIDEFLKPAEGGRRPPRRRWREEREREKARPEEEIQADSVEAAPAPASAPAPCIEDQFQFPVLGGALKH
ncbi:RGG repeats nuclear RNA binding protein A [Vitis vinifera]|uniref:RGG repeats nuclear RNA binding protein A n=1 Tax=Vitis vinifera TaxID=29760 RepID=A0A438DG46_VITVI|nr:RGG repeats nuclear RNA binding protein A [Vitis vinifera]